MIKYNLPKISVVFDMNMAPEKFAQEFIGFAHSVCTGKNVEYSKGIAVGNDLLIKLVTNNLFMSKVVISDGRLYLFGGLCEVGAGPFEEYFEVMPDEAVTYQYPEKAKAGDLTRESARILVKFYQQRIASVSPLKIDMDLRWSPIPNVQLDDQLNMESVVLSPMLRLRHCANMLRDMEHMIAQTDISWDKFNRWLGFAQCLLVVDGLFSLNEVREHHIDPEKTVKPFLEK